MPTDRLHPTEETVLTKPWPTVLRERTPEMVRADNAFLAEARKRSPRYPDANEVMRRLQRRRETVAARVLLGGTVIFAALAPFASDWRFHGLAAVLCFVGFAITCLVAGARCHTEGETL